MNGTIIETQARHQISERVARASAPKMPSTRRHRTARHSISSGLRRFADRLDG